MADATCICGAVLEQPKRGRRKFCSKRCTRAFYYRQPPSTEDEKCSVDDCTRRRAAKGMCLAHRSTVHRQEQAAKGIKRKRHPYKAQYKTKACIHCGSAFETTTSATRYCQDCFKKQPWINPGRIKKSPQLKQCKWCLGLHATKNTYCSRECRSDAALSLRGDFRKAYEDNDYDHLIKLVQAKVKVNEAGCWLWPKLKNGYPIHMFSNGKSSTTIQVHRAVLEAKHRKPLGSQAGHHMCAVPACVNPDHLQPVTHRDNIAEMLQRKSYLARIAELEDALAAIAPAHPLLAVIEVA